MNGNYNGINWNNQMEIAHLLVNNFQGPFCLLIKQIGNWNPPNSHRMYILVFS